MTGLWRKVLTFLLPGLPVWIGAILAVRWGVLSRWFPALVQAFPYMVSLAGILLGWRFGRSRLVFGLLAVLAADRLLDSLSPALLPGDPSAFAARNAVAFLLPVNLIAFAVMRERGVFTLQGLCRVALLAIQVPVVLLLARYPALGLNRWLTGTLPGLGWLALDGVAQPALLLFMLAAIVLLLAFAVHRTPIESGLFWTLLCSFSALATDRPAPATSLFLSAGGLVLLVTAVEISFALAYRDELTGLPARRAMIETLNRQSGRYCVAMADVDHFKKINDTYGHDVGDQVLRMVASQLSKVMEGGRVFRYGGEEFAVLFVERTQEEAVRAVEKVRATQATLDFVLRSRSRPRQKPETPVIPGEPRKTFGVTISIGVAEAGPDDDFWDVLKAADNALYQAKRTGRNRVCTAARRAHGGPSVTDRLS